MKTLKLNHNLAELVRSNQKTTTWRLYDDKDVTVNDEVKLIDKVDPQNPSTWIMVGVARIDKVVEKRLGEVSSQDMADHGYATPNAMLKAMQQFYGPQVNPSTPVKMIHFTLLPDGVGSEASQQPKPAGFVREVKLYADGGSRGNPGPSASGYVILNMENTLIAKRGEYLGITTNNQAEYQALKLGLEDAEQMGVRVVHVFMDSLLVVNQMLGIFKVRNRDLWPIHESIKQVVGSFEAVSFTHVPRALNKLADGAVNETLDAAAGKQ